MSCDSPPLLNHTFFGTAIIVLALTLQSQWYFLALPLLALQSSDDMMFMYIFLPGSLLLETFWKRPGLARDSAFPESMVLVLDFVSFGPCWIPKSVWKVFALKKWVYPRGKSPYHEVRFYHGFNLCTFCVASKLHALIRVETMDTG